MNLWYNGNQISGKVDVHSVSATDYSGGRADSVSVIFADVEEVWPQYNVNFGDVIRIAVSEYDTGDMYVEQIRQYGGLFELRAVSTPLEARDTHDRGWEKISFLQLLSDFAGRYGLSLKAVNVPDCTYERLRQSGASDFAWLARRCMLESCALKVYNGNMVVYHEPAVEAGASVRVIDLGTVDEPVYEGNHHMLYRRCAVIGAKAGGEYSVSEGTQSLAVDDIPVETVGEAQRYARGILRANNKKAVTLSMAIKLDTVYATGEMVDVMSGNILTSGRWFVERVEHNFAGETTNLLLRRPLEGY